MLLAVQCLALMILTPSYVNSFDSVPEGDSTICPEISPGLYGDLLEHGHCTWPGHGRHRSSRAIQGDHDWKAKLARLALAYSDKNAPYKQVFRSAADVPANNSNPFELEPRGSRESKDEPNCPENCVAPPTCCQVTTKVLFPMFGLSLTSNKVVEIIQGKETLAQPIAYRKCTSQTTNLVQGYCQQTVLPRMVYVVPKSLDGGPLKMDLIDIPSSCDCIVSLVPTAATSRINGTPPPSISPLPPLPNSRSVSALPTQD